MLGGREVGNQVCWEVCELGSKQEFKGRYTYRLLGKDERTALAMGKAMI